MGTRGNYYMCGNGCIKVFLGPEGAVPKLLICVFKGSHLSQHQLGLKITNLKKGKMGWCGVRGSELTRPVQTAPQPLMWPQATLDAASITHPNH